MSDTPKEPLEFKDLHEFERFIK